MRCSRGAPPSCHRAFCRPLAKAVKLSPPSTYLGVLPAGVHQREVVEPVQERRACDRHLQVLRLEEVRHPLLPRGMRLPEDDFALRPVFGLPRAHAPFQRTPCRVQLALRMAALHLLKHRDRAQPRHGHEQRQDLFLPQSRQRIGLAAGMTALALLLGWRARVAIDARACARAEPGLGCGDLLGVMGPKGHVILVLSVGDETVGHPILFFGRRRSDQPERRHRRPHGCEPGRDFGG